MDPTERKKLLERSWTDVAEPYLREFAPRFAPWAQDALAQLRSRAAQLPPGPIICVACGPGHELPLLCDALPGRRVIGVDLSQGMCEVARKLAAEQGLLAGPGGGGPVQVLAGDACSLEWATNGEPPAAIFSVFGLQQVRAGLERKQRGALEPTRASRSPAAAIPHRAGHRSLAATALWPPLLPRTRTADAAAGQGAGGLDGGAGPRWRAVRLLLAAAAE